MGFFVGCLRSESDRVRSSDMEDEFKIELLLLCIKRNLLRWLVRMPWGCLHEEGALGSYPWPGNTLAFH